MYQPMKPLPPKESLPTMWDLPSESIDEPGWPDQYHEIQTKLLTETCKPVRIGVGIVAR